jgi:thioester reductase-like protein
LLQVLCESPLVNLVICLVRLPTDSSTIEDLASRQQSVFDARGIELSADSWSKIEFLKWTPGAEFLGLSQEAYQRLASRITHIFHGAWPMDFKRKLPSFEPQIRTVKDLVDLGLFAHSLNPYRRPKIVLASSIAVVGRYGTDKSSAVVPERPMDDSANALPMGYAQAKCVCEKVIESAHVSLRSQVQAVIIRIGQVSGSQATGFWSSGEHFPALVKASQAIGKLPDLQGVSQPACTH